MLNFQRSIFQDLTPAFLINLLQSVRNEPEHFFQPNNVSVELSNFLVIPEGCATTIICNATSLFNRPLWDDSNNS